jgi:hypothetical protein
VYTDKFLNQFGYVENLKAFLQISDSNALNFGFTDFGSVFENVQAVKNLNIIGYYPLAIPTTIPITDTTLIQQLNDLYYAKSYQGTTYISVDTLNLKPILKVDYKKSNLLRIKELENA